MLPHPALSGSAGIPQLRVGSCSTRSTVLGLPLPSPAPDRVGKKCWWPQRMLVPGDLCYPHCPGTHAAAPRRCCFSFPFLMWEAGRCVTAEIFLVHFFFSFFCSTEKPCSARKQIFGLQSQATDFSEISGLQLSLLLCFFPLYPFFSGGNPWETIIKDSSPVHT